VLGAIVLIGAVSRPTSSEWIAGGAAMLIAAGIGAHAALDKRELLVLPASSSELSRARWLLSTGLPLAALMLARVVGGVWHGFPSDEGGAFHATPVRVLFDIVYFSLIGAAIGGQSDRYEPPFDEAPHLFRFLIGVLVMGAIPFVVISWLPDRVSDVSAVAWLVGAMALVVGLRPLLRTPEWHRRASPPVSSTESRPLPVRVQGVVAPLRMSRIEGIWVPMRAAAAQALLWTAFMVGFAVVGQYVKSSLSIWGPFDESITTMRFVTTFGLFPLILLGLCPGLGPWIGALKRLPVA